MLIHTVCFSLRHPVGSDEETEFFRAARATLPHIPGVQDFTIARQVGRHSDLRYQFSMRFEDESAYAAYDTHADHQSFVSDQWGAHVVDFTEFDFIPDPSLGQL